MGGREHTRKQVRERDGHKCRDCGFRRTPQMVANHNENLPTLIGRIKSLDVHHLDGFCGKKSRSYDRVSEIHKLITLCHKCHYNRPEHRCQKESWGGSDGKRKVPKSDYIKIKNLRLQRYTLREIGEIYGVTRERIRQILLL
jgi:hypothetical protein